jgi:NAD(P)-dependent dehydrogenase (short-subunit alcohol dehydrogenase family)
MTGSATGIGAEVRKRLTELGDRVISVDIKEADIVADLSTSRGRETAINGIYKAAPEGLDGFIPVAGLGSQVPDLPRILSVNYFSVRVMTEQLKDLLLKKRGIGVIVSSNSAALPGLNKELINLMLEENNEEKARDFVKTLDGINAYSGSKQALTRWMRRIAPQWAGEGIRLNAIAPGATMTPLLQAGLKDPKYGDAIRNFVVPTGEYGTPAEIANVILFLLSDQATFCCGAVFFVDGGSDAVIRPDRF